MKIFKIEYLKKNKNLSNMEDMIIYVKNSLNNQDEAKRANYI